MAIVVRQLKFGDKEHPVVFNSNALYKLEEKTGLSTERIGLLLMTGRAGYQMMQLILWAGLEAARVRLGTRRDVFTVEEVGDLLDEEGGSPVVWAEGDDGVDEVDGVKTQVREPRPQHPVGKAVQEAWIAAFPKPREVAASNPPEASTADQPGTSS